MLAIADVSAAALSTTVPTLVAGDTGGLIWGSLLIPGWILLAKLHGLYDRDHRAIRHLTVDELPRIALWAITGTAATVTIVSITPAKPVPIGASVAVWLIAFTSCFAFRGVARAVWRSITPPERTVIVGTGPLAAATCRKFQLFPDIHVRVVREWRPEGMTDNGLASLVSSGVDRVIVATEALDERVIAALVRDCRRQHVKLSVIPPMRGIFGTAVGLDRVADLPFVQFNTWDLSRSTLLVKRSLDVVTSLLGLVLLSPLFLAIALAIAIDSRGSPIFAQTRAGRHGRPFRIYKFRTMVAGAERMLDDLIHIDSLQEPVFKLKNDPRVTRVGTVLRKTSLDELPQLINVLKGDMSLVGPRPEQVELTVRYRAEERARLSVKPGLTGPMQVFGRAELTFEERLAVEREYIDNLSVVRDLRIIAMTLSAVVSGRGAF